MPHEPQSDVYVCLAAVCGRIYRQISANGHRSIGRRAGLTLVGIEAALLLHSDAPLAVFGEQVNDWFSEFAGGYNRQF